MTKMAKKMDNSLSCCIGAIGISSANPEQNGMMPKQLEAMEKLHRKA